LHNNQFPAVTILHCSGTMVGANCLVLHNTFKKCTANKLPFIIVDMTHVSSVEKQVWEYFSSKAKKFQSLNGILLFAGIQPTVLSETTDFHKMNICHCETIDMCYKAIRNLVQEHENSSHQIANSKVTDVEQSYEIIEVLDSSGSRAVEKSHLAKDAAVVKEDAVVDQKLEVFYDIDESMSTDFSIAAQEPSELPINVDESMCIDFSTSSENLIHEPDTIVTDTPNDDAVSDGWKNYTNENSTFEGKNHFALDDDKKISWADTQIFDSKEYTLPEKIHIIIARFGPCNFGTIMKKLHSKEFGSEKINALNLYKTLKSMSLDTLKKRIRYYRSC
jgi:anti-anti-sigma regulatory factor